MAEREVRTALHAWPARCACRRFNFLWDFHVEGLEHVPADGPAIFCPNHTSVLDSFFLPMVLPRRITYVGKAEYMDNWKTKYLFPALGMIPIDRSGGDASERALTRRPGVLEAGELFGIYPEGTRSAHRSAAQGPHRPGPAGAAHRRPDHPGRASGQPRHPAARRAGSRSLFRPVLDQLRPADHASQRYADRADDRLVLRQIIDEVMFEIREPVGPGVRRHVRHQDRSCPRRGPHGSTCTRRSRRATGNDRGSDLPIATPA